MEIEKYWSKWLTNNDNNLLEYLEENNVFTEDAYKAFRFSGDPELITKIDLKRFYFMYTKIDNNDPVKLLEFAPLWVRFVSFNAFPTTTRVKNIMKYNGISLVGDFLNYTSSQLLNFRNVGQKSLCDLSYSIYEFVKEPDYEWYENLLRDMPMIQSIFNDKHISGESSYLEHRKELPEEFVSQIDEYRFTSLQAKLQDENPLELLKIIPMWLQDMNINHFRTNQRTKNIILEHKIRCLGDFLNFKVTDLSKVKNIGKGSIKKLYDDILHAKLKGPPPTFDKPLANKLTLLENFEKTIEAIANPKHQFIMEARLGYKRKYQTLDGIAPSFNLTRERVRQIQKEATCTIIEEEFWDKSLKFKLQKLMKDKSKPIVLEYLSDNDPWFNGFQDQIPLLKNIIEAFSHLDVKFITTGTITILSDIDQEEFNALSRLITNNLEETIDVDYSDEDVEAIIENELSERNIPELSDAMFEFISKKLNFVLQDEQLILTSVGSGKASRLKVILEETETPLHYKEIKEVYEDKFSVETSDRSIHAALHHYQFWLYGRGIFGSERHLPLDENTLKKISDDAVKYVEANPEKQWHSSELLKQIKTSKIFEEAKLLDKYMMNICLQEYSNLTYLGKMIWVCSNSANELQKRIEIKHAVIQILTDNNGPMSTKDLTDEIKKKRGVCSNLKLQLHAISTIAKTAPETWGMIYRDFEGDETYWNELTTTLFNTLKLRNIAIHKSELLPLLSNEGIDPLPRLSLVQGIIQSDSRFKIWAGGLLGLHSWSSANRLNLREAVKKLLREGMTDFTTEEMSRKLSQHISYPYKKSGVSVILNDLGFYFDSINQIWLKS